MMVRSTCFLSGYTKRFSFQNEEKIRWEEFDKYMTWGGWSRVWLFFLDVIFIFNKFGWLHFLFFFLIEYHFFNKNIWVNLHKVTFFVPPLSIPNQTKRKEIKIFSSLLLFDPPIIFYPSIFSPLQPNGPLGLPSSFLILDLSCPWIIFISIIFNIASRVIFFFLDPQPFLSLNYFNHFRYNIKGS